jgi:hypothetical protein
MGAPPFCFVIGVTKYFIGGAPFLPFHTINYPLSCNIPPYFRNQKNFSQAKTSSLFQTTFTGFCFVA